MEFLGNFQKTGKKDQWIFAEISKLFVNFEPASENEGSSKVFSSDKLWFPSALISPRLRMSE